MKRWLAAAFAQGDKLPDLGPQDKPYFTHALTGPMWRAFISHCPTT
jgi:hypothetical protein